MIFAQMSYTRKIAFQENVRQRRLRAAKSLIIYHLLINICAIKYIYINMIISVHLYVCVDCD